MAGEVEQSQRSFLQRLANSHLIFPLVFFFVFGAGGVLYLSFSRAATSPAEMRGCAPTENGVPVQSIQRGDNGNCVKLLQDVVIAAVPDNSFDDCVPQGKSAYAVSGEFDEYTECLTKQFQKKCQAVIGKTDGVVDQKTWYAGITYLLYKRCS